MSDFNFYNQLTTISFDSDISLSDLPKFGKFVFLDIFTFAITNAFPCQLDKEFILHIVDTILRQLNLGEDYESFKSSFIGRISQSFSSTITHSIDFGSVELFKMATSNKHYIVIKELITIAMVCGKYDARWRVIIRHFAQSLNISMEYLQTLEQFVIDFYINDLEHNGLRTELEPSTIGANKRKAYMIISSVIAGAAFGLTGGLATPVIAGYLGTLASGTAIGVAGAAALETTGACIAISSATGALGSAYAGRCMQRLVGHLEKIDFLELINPAMPTPKIPCKSNVTLAVSGWILSDGNDEYKKTWLSLALPEQYCLRYETKSLLALGKMLRSFSNFGYDTLNQYISDPSTVSRGVRAVGHVQTVGRGVVSAARGTRGATVAALPSAVFIAITELMTNPWKACISRAVGVGKMLAAELLSRQRFGYRPVSLIGFSIGARVIYHCLLEMAEQPSCRGIIENVYLIGAPCDACPNKWEKLTSVVAGKVTNVYSTQDIVLKCLYTCLSFPRNGVAGLKAIDSGNQKIYNIDVSSIVTGHCNYPENMTAVLEAAGVEVKIPSEERPSEDERIN